VGRILKSAPFEPEIRLDDDESVLIDGVGGVGGCRRGGIGRLVLTNGRLRHRPYVGFFGRLAGPNVEALDLDLASIKTIRRLSRLRGIWMALPGRVPLELELCDGSRLTLQARKLDQWERTLRELLQGRDNSL
jgi:hypothetical protein